MHGTSLPTAEDLIRVALSKDHAPGIFEQLIEIMRNGSYAPMYMGSFEALAAYMAAVINARATHPMPHVTITALANPFLSTRYGEIQTQAGTVDDRIDMVKSFGRIECCAALALPDLQLTVFKAVVQRLAALNRQHKAAEQGHANQSREA